MKKNGLILDANDLLYDSTIWNRWLFRLMCRFGLETSFDAFHEIWKSDYLAEVNIGREDRWDVTNRFLRSLGLGEGEVFEVLAAAKPRWRKLQDAIMLYPTIRPSLAKLSSRIRICIISNSAHSSDELTARFRRLGICAFVDSIVTSIDVSRQLPAKECYEQALEAINANALDVYFVSCHARHLAAAKSLEMASIGIGTECEGITNYDRFDQFANRLDAELQTSRSDARAA